MMHEVLDANRWASEVFGGCALGDTRRTRRLVKTAGMLASQVGSAPSRACNGDSAASEGAYRLVRNDAVEPEAIAEGGFMATARAASRCGELLALEDSTTLGYGHSAAAELGDLGGKEASAR
ncbi:MAG: transposase, partial [Deltaproteobacteria bacterium]|nr:transposase [Deltaproteobacteria bacterium]